MLNTNIIQSSDWNNYEPDDESLALNTATMIQLFKQHLKGGNMYYTEVIDMVKDLCDFKRIAYKIDKDSRLCMFKSGSTSITMHLALFEQAYRECVFQDFNYPSIEEVSKVTEEAQDLVNDITDNLHDIITLCNDNKEVIIKPSIRVVAEFLDKLDNLVAQLMKVINDYEPEILNIYGLKDE